MNGLLFTYLLRLSDSGLILAQRISAWTGHGPFLEEDLALTNIALDIFGRSRNLLEYAAKIENKGRTEDDLAFHRSERHFYNSLISEIPNGDYAQTMLRQAFVDAFELEQYTALSNSKDETIRAIALKSVKEISYHKRHSFSWVKRFGNGTEESMQRLQKALTVVWPFTHDMFERIEGEEELVKAGIAPDMAAIKANWDKTITALMTESGLSPQADVYMHGGSSRAKHSEYLGHLLAEMQSLPRAYPEAKW